MTGLHDWLRMQAGRSPAVYARLRSVKQRFLRLRSRLVAAGSPLPVDAFRARIDVKGGVAPLQVGGVGVLDVQITNASPRVWPGGGAIALSYRLRRADGSVWQSDGSRAHVWRRLRPGQQARVQCAIRAPNTPATYTLELDLVHGRDAWFEASGSPPARLDLMVDGRQPDTLSEIDYEQVYSAADLSKDHWTVTGPGSVEEFRQLSEGKLNLLKGLGLTPQSRVLDVGCGTGSLAEALAGFLASDGLYHGTDLSEVAVQFCRQKYRQANFVFAKNGMTTLPIQGQRFDFIVFFSVFTHTYPPETRELMAEAMRVLDVGGAIIADVFEADIDGDSLGTRAMVVLPRGRMVPLAEAQGLKSRTIAEFAWDVGGPRRIDRILRVFTRDAA